MFMQTLALAGLVTLWYMIAVFLTALMRRDTSIADVAWGPGFLLVALAVLWWHQPAGLRPVLVTVLVAVWAMRLALHILLRNWGRGEDWRYAKWRARWGAHGWARMFGQVFVVQGLLLLFIVVPVLWVNTFGGTKLGWLDGVGAAIWVVGFLWESIGDHQLTRFLKDPANKGHIMRAGLWKYSRHPNYFGEIAQWWGIWFIALSVPGAWMTVIGPLTITFLILKVSGVPILEARQRENPEFREYAKRTSAVLPWFPKK